MSHVSSSASNTEGLHASTTIDAPAEGVFAVCEITSDSPHSRMTTSTTR